MMQQIKQPIAGIMAAIAVILLAAAAMQLPFITKNSNPSQRWSANPGLAAFSPLQAANMTLPTTRICLNMIVKNEQEDLLKLLHTVKDHITGYVICDTGSTDKTVSLAEQFFRSAGLPGTIENHTWINFAASRNLCLDAGVKKMSDSCDFWLILEPDHIFVSEDDILLPSLDLSHYTSYHIEERNQGVVYNTRRLVSTKLKWAYEGAVHEYITVVKDADVQDGGGAIGTLPQGIHSHHNIKYSIKKYEMYRDILEKEVQDHPNDARARYYMGQTYRVLKEFDKAIINWMARINLGKLWDEEYYMAALDLAHEIARIYETEGQEISEETRIALNPWIEMTSTRPTLENVLDGFLRAAYALPYRHEAWYQIAKLYRMGYSNFEKCYEYAKKAKESGPHTADTLFSQAPIVDYRIDDELCICGYYVQEWRAVEACTRLIAKIEKIKEPEEWHLEIKNRTIDNMAFYTSVAEAGQDITASTTNSTNSEFSPTDTPLELNSDGTGKTRVIFHSHQLGNRGTEVAIFDYGMFLELFYEAEAHFAFPFPGWTPIQESPFKKFITTFPGRFHFVHADLWNYPQYRKTLDDIAIAVQASAVYRIELQNPSYEVSSVVPTLVHEVFNCSSSRKMGTKYKAISSFVETQLGGGCTGNVPHMVWLPQCDKHDTLRNELGIKEDAFVFAWYGGHDAWDPSATEIVRKVAVARSIDVVFLLQNFPPSEFLKIGHLKNVILVPSTSSMMHKCRFLQTADAFLHTRLLGETFGLAVAEFSLSGKPIMTNYNTPHRFHLDILGDNAFIYKTYEELEYILMTMTAEKVLRKFPEENKIQLSSLYSEFSPCKVMKKFNEEFFEGRLVPRDNGAVLDAFCAANTQFVDVAELKATLGMHVY